MNYIQSLKKENEELKKTIDDAKEEIAYLKAYLLSSKFHVDPTVQVQDVLNRLGNIHL